MHRASLNQGDIQTGEGENAAASPNQGDIQTGSGKKDGIESELRPSSGPLSNLKAGGD